MSSSKSKGNNPELWDKLIELLDDRLQLGLLDYLSRVSSYHFEDDTLFIVPGGAEDQKYFQRESVFQQLQIFAGEATKVARVKIKPLE